MKKITGASAQGHYRTICPDTGEIFDRIPEYTTMSLKDGGIAGNWYKKFSSDVFPLDSVVIRGKEMKPPKYYDRLLELEDPAARALIKERRMTAALLHQGDNTTARLRSREKVKLAQIGTLKRTTE